MLHQTIEESWNLALVLFSSTDLGSRITDFWLTQALIKAGVNMNVSEILLSLKRG